MQFVRREQTRFTCTKKSAQRLQVYMPITLTDKDLIIDVVIYVQQRIAKMANVEKSK